MKNIFKMTRRLIAKLSVKNTQLKKYKLMHGLSPFPREQRLIDGWGGGVGGCRLPSLLPESGPTPHWQLGQSEATDWNIQRPLLYTSNYTTTFLGQFVLTASPYGKDMRPAYSVAFLLAVLTILK